ncbi:MAG: hypothetical protein WCB04_11020 [Mycobacteriales bacterium]
MPAQISRADAVGQDEEVVLDRIRAQGLLPQAWRNGPGETYGWHEHGYPKVLFCVSGSIVFHTPDGDLSLDTGDRLDLPAHTPHAATVGPDGCRCVEAAADRR